MEEKMQPKTSREGVTEEDVNRVYDTFWKPILETNPDEGQRVQRGVTDFSITQAKKELYDFWVLMQNVPQVYSAVTGGRVSKHMTCPSAVISEFEDYTSEVTREEVKEQTEEITAEKNQALKDLEHLKKNLASAERIRGQNTRLRRAVRQALAEMPFPVGTMKIKKALTDALHFKVQSEEKPQEESSERRDPHAGDTQGSP